MKEELMEKKLIEMKSLMYEAERAYEISINESVDEDTADAAYEEYWSFVNRIAGVIVDLIKVDENTAIKMATHKKDRIMDLLSRMAA
jgi:hypothetical protein